MSRTDWKIFALVLLLGAGLRFLGITFDSLWLDESYQSMLDAFGQSLPNLLHPLTQPFLFHFGTPQNLSQVLSVFRQVDPLCPPLYAVLLNRWMLIFGSSDLAARSLSAIFSLASTAVIYFLTRRFFGHKTAILAATIQALSPFDIYYAQEARTYSLCMFSIALSCGSLLRILHSSEKRIIWSACYVISTWAVINSHYTALFAVMFQILYSIWFCFSSKSYKLFAWLLISWLLTVTLWLPWLDIFTHAASIRTASFYVARQFSWWWPFWALFVRIPFNWICFLSGKQVVAYAIPLYLTSAIMLILAAGALLSSLKKDSPKQTNLSVLIFLWCWAIVPALLIWLLDIREGHRVIEISRYIITTAPAIYILAGVGLSFFWNKPSFVLLLTHAIFALVNNTYAHLVPQREPWAQMAKIVDSKCNPNDLILVSNYYDIVCLDRYLNNPKTQIGISPALGSTYVNNLLKARHLFWLVTAQEGEAVKDFIPPKYKLKEKIDLHHALHLRLYEDR